MLFAGNSTVAEMKTLSGSSDQVIDVRPKLTVEARRRRWVVALCLSLPLACLLWLGYSQIWKPVQFRQTAKVAREAVLASLWWWKDPDLSGRSLVHEPEVDQSLHLANLLAGPAQDHQLMSNQERIKSAHDLYEFAIYLGNPFARIDYGVALLVGQIGLPDQDAANYQFSKANSELRDAAKGGDPRSVLAYSILLGSGYGVEKDYQAAHSLVRQILGELSVDDLLRLSDMATARAGVFKDSEFRGDLHVDVLAKIISKGRGVDKLDIQVACGRKFIDRETAAGKLMEGVSDKELYKLAFDSYLGVVKLEEECINTLAKVDTPVQYAPEAEIVGKKTITKEKSLKFYPADNEKVDTKALVVQPTQKIVKESAKKLPQPDLEKQADTGYLNGTPAYIPAGLSNFTVDNKSGDADAIARIYLNGDKPAIRQIYIKVGESFTAKELAPGNYVLRYRFIGSKNTFEADKLFGLQETATDAGTRYSNVTVTLFKVANGNIKVKQVADSLF